MKIPMNMPLPKDRDSLLRLCREQGCIISKTGGGHVQIRFPNGNIVHHSSTPRMGVRAEENFRAQLKRAGLLPFLPQVKKEKIVSLDDPETLPTLSEVSPPSTTPEVTTVPRKKLPRGELKKVVLESLARINVPEGREAGDILPRIQARFPHVTKDYLNTALNNYTHSGVLEKVGVGRFRVPDKPLERPSRKALKGGNRRTAEPDIPLDVDTENDMKVLDEALAALARVEQVMKKYQQFARQLAPLKALISSVKGE